MTSLAFLRLAPSPAAPNGPGRFQIWSLDIPSRTERMITNLDDAVTSRVEGLTISSDRNWLGFSAYFRPSTPDDLTLGTYTKMIWKVDVAGQRFVRLTPPIEDLRATCTGACPNTGKRCEQGRCTSYIFRYGYAGAPAWSADGRTLLAELGVLECDSETCINSIETPVLGVTFAGPAIVAKVVSIADGQDARPRFLPDRMPGAPAVQCSHYDPVVSPDGKLLASKFQACLRLRADMVPEDIFPGTFILFSDLDGGNARAIRSPGCLDLTWHRDGSGVYCLEHGGQRMSLVRRDGTIATSRIPPTGGREIHSFTVSTRSPAEWVVVSLLTPNRKTDLYLFDPGGPFAWQQLTTDGGSVQPFF